MAVPEPPASPVKTKLAQRNGKPFSKSFLSRVDEGAFWESFVATILCRNGLYVLHNPFQLGECSDPIAATTCDLVVGYSPILDPSWDVEVKSKKKSFSDPSDLWGEELLLCSQSWFLKNFPGYDSTGRDFLIVSAATQEILWVPYGTPVKLGVEVVDNQRGEVYKAVTVDPYAICTLPEFVNHVKFHEGKHG